jgi:hypothetical protein
MVVSITLGAGGSIVGTSTTLLAGRSRVGIAVGIFLFFKTSRPVHCVPAFLPGMAGA